ncbi:MAG: alanine--tRNA ligase, partial [Ruminiclostridium sp.]|nr:alanine--tRNA ligase [Ruminiclostridium sp.]
ETSAWGQESAAGLDKDGRTEFTGYTETLTQASALYIIKDGEPVENAQEGDEITVILDRTPFYAESGGQTGDAGVIEAADGAVRVSDCKKTHEGKYLHVGIVEKGIIEKASTVTARVDTGRRLATARNHTVTHLIQKALQNALGNHVTQAGSLGGPDRLRFDFNHFSAMTREELKSVEREVNAKILESIPVTIREMPVDEARKEGAMALFGEKYGNIVRVVRIGDYSIELCGGTHLASTSQAGLVKLLGESGVAAGVRRLEALTGEGAIQYFNEREDILNTVAAVLKSNPQDSVRKIEILNADLKNAGREIEKLRSKLVSGSVDEVLSSAVDVKGIKVVAARFDQLDMEALRNTGDMLKNKLGSGVVILASGLGEKVSFVVMASTDAVQRGAHAGNIVREAAKVAGGGGGGRPDMAQAGGKDVSKIDEALKLAVKVAGEQIK